MEYLKRLMEKKNVPQLILTILFILYLVFGYKIPSGIAEKIDTMTGKIVISILALLLFAYSNPILGILGLVTAYELIKGSSVTTGSAVLAKYYPTEEKKWTPFTAENQFPYTLEQEIVSKMAPVRNADSVNTQASFKPILDDTYDAAPINYTGPI